MNSPEGTPRAQFLRGVSWVGLLSAVQLGVGIVLGIAMARLLTPDAFGIFAIGCLGIQILDAVLRAPVGDAIVNRQHDDDDYYHTAWTFHMRRFPVGLTVCLLAPRIAAYFHQPAAADVARWLSVIYILGAFESPAMLVFRLRLDFKRFALMPHLTFWIAAASVSRPCRAP